MTVYLDILDTIRTNYFRTLLDNRFFGQIDESCFSKKTINSFKGEETFCQQKFQKFRFRQNDLRFCKNNLCCLASNMYRWPSLYAVFLSAISHICDPEMTFYSGTHPLIISHPWSFYMRICYMRVYFWSPYLSHITRSNCTSKFLPPT